MAGSILSRMGDGINNRLEGFGFGFEAESLVDFGESQLGLDADVEINASGLGVQFESHTFYCGCFVVV
jgi:hypothetical protein